MSQLLVVVETFVCPLPPIGPLGSRRASVGQHMQELSRSRAGAEPGAAAWTTPGHAPLAPPLDMEITEWEKPSQRKKEF